MPAIRVVLDASAFIRGIGLPDPNDEAFGWIEAFHERRVEPLAPDLLYAEVANGLLVYVRASALARDAAAGILARLLRLRSRCSLSAIWRYPLSTWPRPGASVSTTPAT